MRDSGVHNGVCHLYVSHTTAGIIINEHADPDVARDIEIALDRLVPQKAGYRHAEGNSDSHIKTALIGTSATLFIADGASNWAAGRAFSSVNSMVPASALRIKIVPD